MKKIAILLCSTLVLLACSTEAIDQTQNDTAAKTITSVANKESKGEKYSEEQVLAYMDKYQAYKEEPGNFEGEVIIRDEALYMMKATINRTHPFEYQYYNEFEKVTIEEGQLPELELVSDIEVTLNSSFAILDKLLDFISNTYNEEKIHYHTDLNLLGNAIILANVYTAVGINDPLPPLELTAADNWHGYYNSNSGGQCASGPTNFAPHWGSAERLAQIINHNYRNGHLNAIGYSYNSNAPYTIVENTYWIPASGASYDPLYYRQVQNTCIPPFTPGIGGYNMQDMINSYFQKFAATMTPTMEMLSVKIDSEMILAQYNLTGQDIFRHKYKVAYKQY